MVFSCVKLFPSGRQRRQLIELLRSVQDLTSQCPGCAGSWFSEEDVLHDYIHYSEQWESEEALRQHIRSDLYRRLLAAMELSQRPPDVKFYYCSQTKGLDLIQTVRQQPHAADEISNSN